MARQWHTNKTKPKAYEQIVYIDKTGCVGMDIVLLNTSRRCYMEGLDFNSFWENEVALWQYTDKLFENEIKQVKV